MPWDKLKKREYMKKYRQDNEEKLKEYREKNKEKVKEQKRLYYLANKEKINKRNKKWNEKNKKKVTEKTKLYYLKNKEKIFSIENRLWRNLTNRCWNGLKRDNAVRCDSHQALIGCNKYEFKDYMESLWTEGMSWENYGRGHGKWQIDHIKPLTSFDLTDPEQQKKCFHHSNCQPLWFADNMKKGYK